MKILGGIKYELNAQDVCSKCKIQEGGKCQHLWDIAKMLSKVHKHKFEFVISDCPSYVVKKARKDKDDFGDQKNNKLEK